MSRGFLDQIGIRPGLGRNFTREEDSLGRSRSLDSLLYGVTPGDHDTRRSLLLFAAIAAAGSYIPARRAAALHPMDTLRHE